MVNAFATRELLTSSSDLISRLDSFMPFCRTHSTSADLMAPEAETLEAQAEYGPFVEMTISVGMYDAQIKEGSVDWRGDCGMPVIDSQYRPEVGAEKSIVEIEEMSDVTLNADFLAGAPTDIQKKDEVQHFIGQENVKPSPVSKKRRVANLSTTTSLIEEI